jgi:ribosome maturation factor RimP
MIRLLAWVEPTPFVCHIGGPNRASMKEEVTIAVSTIERVREVIEPLLAARSVPLYDLELAGGHLRVTLETADLQVIEELTRAMSRALDEADPIDSRYTLEVSSPGLERPLRTPAHFAGAIGTPVKVKTKPEATSTADHGDRRVEGTLTAADDHGITVGERTLRYDEIERARTVFEWGPAPKPGGTSNKTKSAANTKAATP